MDDLPCLGLATPVASEILSSGYVESRKRLWLLLGAESGRALALVGICPSDLFFCIEALPDGPPQLCHTHRGTQRSGVKYRIKCGGALVRCRESCRPWWTATCARCWQLSQSRGISRNTLHVPLVDCKFHEVLCNASSLSGRTPRPHRLLPSLGKPIVQFSCQRLK